MSSCELTLGHYRDTRVSHMVLQKFQGQAQGEEMNNTQTSWESGALHLLSRSGTPEDALYDLLGYVAFSVFAGESGFKLMNLSVKVVLRNEKFRWLIT